MRYQVIADLNERTIKILDLQNKRATYIVQRDETPGEYLYYVSNNESIEIPVDTLWHEFKNEKGNDCIAFSLYSKPVVYNEHKDLYDYGNFNFDITIDLWKIYCVHYSTEF
jgi:hypothetical protein